LKQQKTIKTESKLSGRGLFSGADCRVVFKPGKPDSGVVFVRTDVQDSVAIPALIENVVEQARRSTLRKGKVGVETVEHCLAAVSALGIDNLVIEVSAPELPAPDCSSVEFYKALVKAGIEEQQSRQKEFTISEPVSLTLNDASIYALPYEDEVMNITYDLDYGLHTGIGRQMYSCRLTSDVFEKNLATARTFLLEAEAKQFQAKGLGKHLGPKDILVINSDGPVKNSYRYDNECVRHKIVDLIGDLKLTGVTLRGRIVAYKSGHSLNQALARKLYETIRRSERIARTGTDALLDIRRIQKILPHRYPFLMVDRVIEIVGDSRITGVKNVSFNELFFQGHFPGTPIMPGVLVIEALAQVSGLLFAQRLEHMGQLAVLLGMDQVKFRKTVVPGDQLILQSEALKIRKRTALCRCRAMVGDTVVAEADIKFMLVDDEKI